ncbi:hypothetical protein PR048_029823 [Dryococelus australis]|uniref:HAT C-terminal dimerisation domain-containing protein n=1 Tax=Dryococelus australis TaxID=614101 RepID=A0ABQ9G853_9NEOP|nr:hypothetical protein PR048_029823 [Dryococelus australis]
MSCSKYRKVDTENIQFKTEWMDQFSFAMAGINKPMCLICNEVVSVVKVCNLKLHYKSKHKEFHIVKECMLQSVNVMEGEETVRKYQKIPLSNDTATQHSNELANNISCQLVSELSQSSCFSLAADESTDISDIAQLSVFVRFFNGERFLDELLGLIPLYRRTTGEMIFYEISKLLASKSVSIANIVSVVTDGAPAMASEQEGLVGKLKQINSIKIFFSLLTEITKLVNFFRSRSALTHRNLKQFLNDLDSEFKDVLFYNNVRWLSKRQILKILGFERKKIVLFLELMDTSEKRDHFLNLLRDPNQLIKLSFLIYILSYLNNMNLMAFAYRHYTTKLIYELKDWFSIEVRLKLEMCDFSVQLSVNETKTSTDYINFWIELSKMNKFPYITETAIKILTMLGSTWNCESTFRVMTNIKCKNRISLKDDTLENLIRISRTSYESRHAELMKNITSHFPH